MKLAAAKAPIDAAEAASSASAAAAAARKRATATFFMPASEKRARMAAEAAEAAAAAAAKAKAEAGEKAAAQKTGADADDAEIVDAAAATTTSSAPPPSPQQKTKTAPLFLKPHEKRAEAERAKREAERQRAEAGRLALREEIAALRATAQQGSGGGKRSVHPGLLRGLGGAATAAAERALAGNSVGGGENAGEVPALLSLPPPPPFPAATAHANAPPRTAALFPPRSPSLPSTDVFGASIREGKGLAASAERRAREAEAGQRVAAPAAAAEGGRREGGGAALLRCLPRHEDERAGGDEGIPPPSWSGAVRFDRVAALDGYLNAASGGRWPGVGPAPADAPRPPLFGRSCCVAGGVVPAGRCRRVLLGSPQARAAHPRICRESIPGCCGRGDAVVCNLALLPGASGLPRTGPGSQCRAFS